jgi:hypothetical protein
MAAFDPTLSCPIIRNFQCAQTDCSFWDTARSECIFFSGLAKKNGYNELTGTVSTVETTLDLGQVFTDIMVYVTGAATLKFHATANASIALSATYGRVGVPIIFKGINARYVLLTSSSGTISYAVEGNS